MLALVVAVVLLLAHPRSPRANEDDPVIATVNGYPLRQSYVYQQLEALPLGDQVAIRQQLDGFAESVVREEILFQYLLASGFEAEPVLRESVKTTAVEFLIERHVKARIRVTDEQVRAFYDANTSAIRGESVRASQILLAERSQCEALASSIGSASQFEAAARRQSLHRSSARRGGDLGLFMNHAGPLGFETALFAMQPGQMKVFESVDGCHLVRVTQRETPPLPPLGDVEARIRGLLQTRQERELLGSLLERARKAVTVERPATKP